MYIEVWYGFILDILLGDPKWFPHPVRLIGNLIQALENIFRKIFTSRNGLRIAGIILVCITVSITYMFFRAVLKISMNFGEIYYQIASVIIIYFLLATRCLAHEAKGIKNSLENSLELARNKLSYIVGRDTENLSEEEVVRATIETVAENISDGIIAPLIYIFIGGPALGMAYKAVNTLDSMVGYDNEKYRDFGWASAKLDDLANCIPARITGLLILLAGSILGKGFVHSFKIFKRDRRNHKSPNAGFPEAAMAGVLGVRIGGINSYFGKPVYKPTIGDSLKSLEKEDIIEAIRVMFLTSFLGVIFLQILNVFWVRWF